MKMPRSKRAETGLLMLPTFGFIVGIILFFVFGAPKIDDFIGGKQGAVLSAVGKGEQALSFVDASAQMAGWDAVYDLGNKGGFHFLQEGYDNRLEPELYPCRRYGYVMWNADSNKCSPDFRESYKAFFDERFKLDYLTQIGNPILDTRLYDYTLSDSKEGTMILRGMADGVIPIKMSYDIAQEKEAESVAGSEVPPRYFLPDDKGFFSWPLNSNTRIVVSGFGRRSISDGSEDHGGIDIRAQAGTDVLAAADGKVIFTDDCWGAIIIDHGNKFRTEYIHLSSFSVANGAAVKKGQVIGKSGASGKSKRSGGACSANAFDAHLHFAISYTDANPSLKLPDGQMLVKDGFKWDSTGKNVQPLCFYDSAKYQKLGGNMNNPVNSRLTEICGFYNFPAAVIDYGKNDPEEKTEPPAEQTTKPSAEAAIKPGTTTTGTTTGTTADTTTAVPSAASSTQSSTNNPSAGVIPDAAIENIPKFKSIINAAANTEPYKTNGVTPELLMGIFTQESRGKTDAISPSGCIGIAQFCADTARMFKEFDGKISVCRCAGKTMNSKGVEYCSSWSGCTIENDNRFNAEKSIYAAAHLMSDNLDGFKRYTNKHAFAIAAYNAGGGIVNKAIRATGKSDPTWQEVSAQITGEMIYDAYCDGGRSKKGYFCGQGAACATGRCQAKVEEVVKYVDNVLKYAQAWGGGIPSTPSTSEIAFTRSDIGYYYVNPSFTTEVNYNLHVYDSIMAWANDTYAACAGINSNVKRCVDKKVEEHNALMDNLSVMNSTNTLTGFGLSSAALSIFVDAANATRFKFQTDLSVCDGDSAWFFKYIEAFENCMDSSDGCRCVMPEVPEGQYIDISVDRIAWFNIKRELKEEYYFSEQQRLNFINDNKKEFTYLQANAKGNNSLFIKYFDKDGKTVSSTTSTYDRLYFIKTAADTAQASQASMTLLQTFKVETGVCKLEENTRKFRFCAYSDYTVPHYKDGNIVLEQVPIKFALNIEKSAPPPMTANSVNVFGAGDEGLAPEKEGVCKAAGKASIDVKLSNQNLKPAYDQFASKLITSIAPSVSVALFAQNILTSQKEISSSATVTIDMKGIDDPAACDIKGIVYKCGPVEKLPMKGGRFDFSEPNGYIVLVSGGISAPGKSGEDEKPWWCNPFKNPDGSLTKGNIRFITPIRDGTKITFTIPHCGEPISQFKNLKGLDILSLALNQQFGYYFAFAYYDGVKYGPAAIEFKNTIPILKQLQEQLGLLPLSANFELKLLGDQIMKDLNVNDALSGVRKAISDVSISGLSDNLKADALKKGYDALNKALSDIDKKEIFNKMADAKQNAKELLESIKYTPADINQILRNLDTEGLQKAREFIQGLDIDAKKQILAQYYGEGTDQARKVASMSAEAINEAISAIWSKKEEALKLINSISPEIKERLFKKIAYEMPEKTIGWVRDVVSDAKKADAIGQVLSAAGDAKNSALEAYKNAASWISHLSPNSAIQEMLSAINGPDLSMFTDINKLFSEIKWPC